MKIPAIAWAAILLATMACATQTNELRAALKLKPDPKHGAALYETCASCHRANGAGAAHDGVPNLAGQHYQVIIKQLVDFRDTERLDLRMEGFASQHYLEGPQDLADIAAHISNLTPQPTNNVGSGEYTRLGAAAYLRACRHCHGEAAQGDNRLRYPRLAGQHYNYLIKQIDMMIGGTRFNVSWDHAKLLENLTDEEIVGLADYLARLNAVSVAPL